MTKEQIKTINLLKQIVGRKNTLTKKSHTLFYRKGFRYGKGKAIAVVFPVTIIEQWRLIKACVERNCIIIFQAANTGLTGGSTPNGSNYDRDVVIINTLKINQIYLSKDASKAVSLSGATLYTLVSKLEKFNRTPHSIIGSSQIGSTVIGGIANNSGGALVKRGPAYTEFSLYAQVDQFGKLRLINNLGLGDLGADPEEILSNVQKGNFDIERFNKFNRFNTGMASDTDYVDWIRDVESDTPSRFNSDSRRLYEASGCAGKIGVFAVVTDTFKKPNTEKLFYFGTNSPKNFSSLRLNFLKEFKFLPNMAEYMHRDTFNVAEVYGKDVFTTINFFGSRAMPLFFKIKSRASHLIEKIPLLNHESLDKILFYIGKLLPINIPKQALQFKDKYEHHLLLSVDDNCIKEIQSFIDKYWSRDSDNGFFECKSSDREKILLHRFVAGGAIGSFKKVNSKTVGDILAVDVALRRNDLNWYKKFPNEIQKHIEYSFLYGHFLCNVFHMNYILKKGSNKEYVISKILEYLESEGAKYPAEHNVGHEYTAESNLKEFYKNLDPTNTFNPGIGKTSKVSNSCSCC